MTISWIERQFSHFNSEFIASALYYNKVVIVHYKKNICQIQPIRPFKLLKKIAQKTCFCHIFLISLNLRKLRIRKI